MLPAHAPAGGANSNNNTGGGGRPSPPSGAPPYHSAHKALGLACRECQRKKTRCDRTYPCTPCARQGIPCVPSTRKPRAKAGGVAKAVDAELRSRIAKLEKLVESFQGEEAAAAAGGGVQAQVQQVQQALPQQQQQRTGSWAGSEASPGGSAAGSGDGDGGRAPNRWSVAEGTSPPPPPPRPEFTSKYLAGSFWSSLTAEVQALREVFDEDDGRHSDDEPDSSEPTPSSGSQSLDFAGASMPGFELMLCPPGALFVVPGAMTEPDPAIGKLLFEQFMQHIEPLYRVCHTPTLRQFMEHGAPLYGRDAEAPCNRALRASIYFSAAVSLSEQEAQTYFSKSRDMVALDFRKYVDLALYHADPLNSTELATMQALMIYVFAIRVVDSSRRAWSLVGLLARIARGASIHREMAGETIYYAELRRRLWHNIILLDFYASFDRGSERAIHPATFTRRLPSHVNDADFGPDTTELVPREGELTDMSLALMAQDGAEVGQRVSMPEEEGEGGAGAGQSWQTRLEYAYAFQRDIQHKYLRHCDPTVPMQALQLGIGYAASHSMILRAIRPMQYQLASVPPRVDSPWVLQLAVNILRHCEAMWQNELVCGLRRMPWVPWHAIAVALAGLCSIRDTDLANEAWRLVDQSMLVYAQTVADSRNGSLWKPIERLRKKAMAFRDGKVPGSATTTTTATLTSPVEAPSAAAAPATNTTANAGTSNGQPNPPSFDMDLASVPQFADLAANSNPTTNNLNDNIDLDTLISDFDQSVPLPDSAFNFPPEVLNSLPPADTSWFYWETMMKDMGETTTLMDDTPFM